MTNDKIVRDSGELRLVLGSLIGLSAKQKQDRTVRSHPDMHADPVVSFETSRQHKQNLHADGYSRSREFVIMPSRSAPRWLLPLDNAATTAKSFNIYVPYAPIPRILKSIASSLLRSGWVGWPWDRVVVSSTGPLPLEDLVSELTGERCPVFSFSLGEPGRFQKVTVQVMGRDGVVLGYFKLPLSEPAKDFVRHEAAILKRLENSPLRPYIPRLLYAGPWDDDGYILFQSPLNGVPGPTVLTSEHYKLLNIMREVHLVFKPGPAIVEHVGERWRKVAPQLGPKWSQIGDQILHCCALSLASASLPCGLMHGDFTPWNSKLDHGELLLFDWESAEEEAPLDWDVFHFQVQTEGCLRKQRLAPLRKNSSMACYLLYLLYSVTRLAEAGPNTKPAIDYREKLAGDQLARSPG